MADRTWLGFAGAAVLIAIAGTGLWIATAEPSAPRDPTAAELGALQSQADAACRCARQRGGSPWREDCWADFNRNLSRFEHQDMATACREESVALTCFRGGPTGERCVARQRDYGGCSDEESRRLEARARARHESGCSD